MINELGSILETLSDYRPREVVVEGQRVIKMNCGVCEKAGTRYCYEPLTRVSMCANCGVVRSILDLPGSTADLLPLRTFWEGISLLRYSLSLQNAPSDLFLPLGVCSAMDDPFTKLLGLSYVFVPSVGGFLDVFCPSQSRSGRKRWYTRPALLAPVVSSPGNLVGLRILLNEIDRRTVLFSPATRQGFVYLNFVGGVVPHDIPNEESISSLLPEILQGGVDYRVKFTK